MPRPSHHGAAHEQPQHEGGRHRRRVARSQVRGRSCPAHLHLDPSPQGDRFLPQGMHDGGAQVRDVLRNDLDNRTKAAEELAEMENLPTSLEQLVTDMAEWDPVSTVNHLLESNPGLNLRDIPHLPDLTILKAVLTMRMTNEAYL